MATRRLFFVAACLLAALAGCGNGSGHGQPMDMATGGGDLADGGSAGPTVGGTVTGLAGAGLVLENNGGDDLTVAASGAFTFATPLSDGAGYDVTVKTQPSNPGQLCAVSNGSGTVAGGNVESVMVRCSPVVRFVLVADKSDNSVATFALDAASGRLRYAGKTAAPFAPRSVAADPSGHFAYVAVNGAVLQFAVDGNGQLTPLSPAMVSIGGGGGAVTVDPSGTSAYVARGDAIAQFGIDTGGRLVALPASPPLVTDDTDIVVVEPSGRFAYGVTAKSGNVAEYSVGLMGALSRLATPSITAGTSPSGIAVDPTGRFVYVTDGAGAIVSQFTIGSDGALAAHGTVPAGAGATAPFVDPSGRFLFVVNTSDKTISQYSIGSDGTLTAAAATAPAGTGAAAVIVDGSGKFAWVANPGDDSVAQYTVKSDGTLAANAPATVPGQLAPTALALVGGSGFAQPTASHAFVSDSGGKVRDFPVAADGTLGAPTTITTGHSPQSIVLDAAGTHAYVLDNSVLGGAGNILQYAVSSSGAWTALTPPTVAAGTAPGAIALHPSGRFAYVANSDNAADTISQFAVAADGTVTALATPTVATSSLPVAVAVDPTGRFAYVATTSTVDQLTIGADGTLTASGTATVPGGAQPSGVAVDPTGRFAYVSNASGGAVLQYSIDSTNGHLTALSPASVNAAAGPAGIAVDPSGRFAYVVDGTACTVSQYALGAGGALGPLSPANVAAGNCTAMDFVAFVAVDPSGRFVYVPDSGTSSGSVLQYALGASGALAPLSPAATTGISGAALMQLAFLVRYQ